MNPALILTLFTLLFISGCDQNNSRITEKFDSNGCLSKQNADYSFEYSINDNTAKHLVWKCIYDAESRNYRQIEKFYVFDNEDQCFKKPALLSDEDYYGFLSSHNCDFPSTPPDNVTFGVDIIDFYHEIRVSDENTYISFQTFFHNTSNINAYRLMGNYTITSSDTNNIIYQDSYTLGLIPANSESSFVGAFFCEDCAPSDVLFVNSVVTDYFGTNLAETSYEVTIP